MYRCEIWPIKKAEHWVLLNCGPGGLLRGPWTARRLNQLILRKSTLNIHWMDWCWSSNTLATWCKQPTHWKRPWCWERAGGQEKKRAAEGEIVGQHYQINGHEFEQTGRQWRTGKSGVLQSMQSQRIGHNLVTEQHSSVITLGKKNDLFFVS